MPDPKQILSGEIKYSLKDFHDELMKIWVDAGFPGEFTAKQKQESFKSLFMFILLSSEEKSISVMAKVFNKASDQQIKEMQKTFELEINVARHIQMRKFLDFYGEYMSGEEITIKLLNIWIRDFLKKYIKEDENGTT